MERLESRTSCSMPGREKDIAGSPQKWLGPEARAARERPPLRGNFHCFRTATLRHERLETFGSAGAGESEGYLRFYKHPAPLEPGRANDIAGSTNIRLSWSRGERWIISDSTFGSCGLGVSGQASFPQVNYRNSSAESPKLIPELPRRLPSPER